jgi:TgpA N-terminal domain/Transglutaminase-like superfamily
MTLTTERPATQPSHRRVNPPEPRRTEAMSAAFNSTRLPVSAAVATILSCICLGGTFLTGAWFFPAVFAVLVTIGGAEVARRLSSPRSLVPVAGAAALLVYLVLMYARNDAYLWVIPNRPALEHLNHLLNAGRTDISRYAAPIAVSPGIEFLVTSGVGLVALAVDTLAVTMRRAALAGLALLALYTVPTTVAPNGVGWLAFALGGIGYLTLLLAEARERVSRWGRPMRYSTPRANYQPEVETAPLAQVGRRVGAVALGLALIVPALLPNISGATFGFSGQGFGRGHGGGKSVTVINPILALGQDLRQGANKEVIRYTGKETYVRLTGLDVFTGDKWAPGTFKVSNKKNDVTDGLIAPPGLAQPVKRTPRKYSFQVFDLSTTWLPLPYPAQLVSKIDGRWVYDEVSFNVIPTNGTKDNFTYNVDSLAVEPTAADLRKAGAAPASLNGLTELPRNMPAIVDRTAKEWTAGAKTQFDQAVAIQTHLRSSDFTYTTQVQDTLGDATGVQAVAAFLQQRAGYCVHFASTMAVLARDLGIPARVAVGFTAGELQKDGSHVVKTHDAHAWPELYFSGVGWVAFEPTPAGKRTPTPGFSSGAGALTGAAGDPTNPSGGPSPAATSSARIPQGVPTLPSGKAKPRGGAINVAGRQLPLLPIGITLAVLLVALVPLLARTWIRRERWRRATTPAALATATWDELLDTLLDYGYEWRASDPPRSGAERLAKEQGFAGDTSDALRRLASATERSRYAPELGEVGDLRADVETVRATLREQATLWGRFRAQFLPRSAKSVSRAISDRFADLLDGLDNIGTRLRPRPPQPTGK